jgi:predicted 3-demethylubiquinone-9 3-methyltransferase (glyoxalase superfamily)
MRRVRSLLADHSNASLRLTRDPNRAKATAATNAMLQMGKIDIAALEAAFASA